MDHTIVEILVGYVVAGALIIGAPINEPNLDSQSKTVEPPQI